MQVSHVQDHVTHAVIGGSKVINFGVSDDAELMNVLSKALYTDQMLAVVREGLCNAWDAHVEAGCTDRPIEITVNKEQIIIRDYGWGIPFDLIGPIYGTYGGSTKKHDGKQTGGFGLGCKSPFAYTDHFEVTSWSKIDEQMTIYKMSKSNAQVGGKPGIIPIVRVPNTSGETGLKVVIDLKNPHDAVRFEALVRRIASNGGMLCQLNGLMLDVLPFDEVKHNFLITKTKVLETTHQVTLRYGHVIYPVESVPEIRHLHEKVCNLLQKIPRRQMYGGSNTDWHIIFQAEPNSVSITPSREALSMQEHTIGTIKQLLTDFLTMAESNLEKGCNELLESRINNTWLISSPKALFTDTDKIPNMPADDGVESIITEFDQFVIRYASHSYPSFKGFGQKDKIGRLNALIEAGFGDKKLIESLKAEFLDPAKDDKGYAAGPKAWFKKNMLDPVIKDLATDENLHVDKFFMFDRSKHGGNDLIKLSELREQYGNVLGYMPYLRKVLILAHNKQDFEYRAREFPVMKFWLGDIKNSFFYTVARSPRKVEAAKAFFESRGFTILDLTKAQPWEPQDAAAPIEKPIRIKPRRKGIPALSCVLDSNGAINLERIATAVEDQVESPEYVMKITKGIESYKLPDHTSSVSKYILAQWGKLGGIVVNSAQEAKYVAMGAMTYEDFILDKILEEFETNPRIQKSLPFLWDRTDLFSRGKYRYDNNAQHIMEAVYGDRDMMEYFGIDVVTTPEDDLYLKMWNEVSGFTGTRSQQKKIKLFLDGFKLDQAVYDLGDKIRSSTLLNYIERYPIMLAMTRKDHVTPQQKLVLRDMLLAAIEG